MKSPKRPKIRLDDLLVERGLAGDRRQAQALILSGAILVDERPAASAGTLTPADAQLRVRGESSPYVSRGGIKLRGALDSFGISVAGLTALDVGASTGGFTDCLLQAGAAKVYAVDVAYGQLAWKLREDPRVVAIERTNIRTYGGDRISDGIDIAVIDVSFISLRLVLAPVLKLLTTGGLIVALVKPQFEAGKGEVDDRGVVRDPELHRRVLAEVEAYGRDLGMTFLGQCDSPLEGPAGNKEFFLCFKKPPAG